MVPEPSEPAPGPPGQPPGETLALLAQARRGDSASLNRLCARILPRLRRWASGRLPARARDLLATDDIVQETVLGVVRGAERFVPRHDGAFQAYLRQAVHNRILNELRRVSRKPVQEVLEAEPAHGDQSPLERAIGKENVERYEKALQSLSEDDRAAVILRLEMGYSYAEIAVALMRPSPDAARMSVSRAIRKLAQELRDGR